MQYTTCAPLGARRQGREYGYDRHNHDEFDDREAALSGSPDLNLRIPGRLR